MTILDMLVGGMPRHQHVHNVKRLDLLSNTPSQILYTTRITFGSGDASSATNSLSTLLTDVRTDPTSAFTTVTQTYAEVIQQPGVTVTSTYASAVAITDAAQYSSLRASESSANAAVASTTTPTSTASASTSSTTAAASSSSGGIGNLIPAIVIPVVIVLISSLALFWFIMRRRHQRQLEEEPEFVMATKPEKTLARGNSNASGTSSTRELVPMSKLEKEVAISTTEVRKSPTSFSRPKYSTTDIGVAHPMMPSDKMNANSNPFAKDKTPAVPNFSSVRPGTAGRTRPSQDFNTDNPKERMQRSQDSSDDRRGRVAVQGSRGPPRRGESPFMAGSRGSIPRSHRPGDNGSRSRPRSPVNRQPSPLNTQLSTNDGSLAPKTLNPPTPTGAFNGASPISNFSPIIKEPSNSQESSLKPSSKTGYNHHIDKTLLPLPERQSKAESLPSPELPPPLTREDMPPRLFANGRNSPAGSSSYQSPSLGIGGTSQAYINQSTQNNQSTDRGLDHRLSIISKISSDDDYVDMEVDNKSDVSSLDERDRWEIESDQLGSSSRLATGYGSAGMSPIEGPSSRDLPSGSGPRPGNNKTNANSNLRDRDSEGPFVLSRY